MCPKYGVFSGPYSVRMRENTDQKKLRIWTHNAVSVFSTKRAFVTDFRGYNFISIKLSLRFLMAEMIVHHVAL